MVGEEVAAVVFVGDTEEEDEVDTVVAVGVDIILTTRERERAFRDNMCKRRLDKGKELATVHWMRAESVCNRLSNSLIRKILITIAQNTKIKDAFKGTSNRSVLFSRQVRGQKKMNCWVPLLRLSYTLLFEFLFEVVISFFTKIKSN